MNFVNQTRGKIGGNKQGENYPPPPKQSQEIPWNLSIDCMGFKKIKNKLCWQFQKLAVFPKVRKKEKTEIQQLAAGKYSDILRLVAGNILWNSSIIQENITKYYS